jgi:hypothetical protein
MSKQAEGTAGMKIKGNRWVLPDDLALLALEFTYSGRDQDEPTEFFIHLGCSTDTTSDAYEPRQKTIFGTANSYRYRFNIIATKTNIERWIEEKLFVPSRSCKLQLTNSKILDRIPTTDEEDQGPNDEWGNQEEFITTVRTQVVTDNCFDTLRQLKEACDDDFITVGKQAHAIELENDVAAAPTFLVEGLIPKNSLTILLGVTGVGKGALLLQLACDAAMGAKEWIGLPLHPVRGFVVYLYGEDSPEEISRRMNLLCDSKYPPRLRLVRYDGQPLNDILDRFKDVRVDLLIIDPARKFFQGDEDGSDAVNKFFGDLDSFFERTHAAVVAAHHLRRGAAPRSVNDVPNHMRGSQVFLDRPRVVIAVHRAHGMTSIGIPITPAGPRHNMDTRVMLRGVQQLERNENTFRHVLVGTDDVRRVKAALARLDDQERSTIGADTLFKRELPELAGMSRIAVRAAFPIAMNGSSSEGE